mmetsp:Transcript_35926/g.76630  ORF Transcript_35926/g.76630 Transcript_35926/m.76630 type:complete len:265 (-) Transcript_35926:71-865(-)
MSASPMSCGDSIMGSVSTMLGTFATGSPTCSSSEMSESASMLSVATLGKAALVLGACIIEFLRIAKAVEKRSSQLVVNSPRQGVLSGAMTPSRTMLRCLLIFLVLKPVLSLSRCLTAFLWVPLPDAVLLRRLPLAEGAELIEPRRLPRLGCRFPWPSLRVVRMRVTACPGSSPSLLEAPAFTVVRIVNFSAVSLGWVGIVWCSSGTYTTLQSFPVSFLDCLLSQKGIARVCSPYSAAKRYPAETVPTGRPRARDPQLLLLANAV